MKKRLGAALGAIVLVAAFAAFAAPLQSEKITLQYGVFSGGFEALHATVNMNLTPKSYAIGMNAQSYGLLGKLLPWAGNHQTRGDVKQGRLVPAVHDKISNWRGDTDHVVLEYKNGDLTRQSKIKTENGRERREDVRPDPAFHAQTTDTLSAVTQMLISANEKGDCNFSQVVYDGKRRFALTFKDEGTEILPPSKLNIFQGEARKCQVEMVPEKGFDDGAKRKGYYGIQEHAREHGQLPRVWMGKLWKDGPLLPVRILMKTQYGAVFVHLTKASH